MLTEILIAHLLADDGAAVDVLDSGHCGLPIRSLAKAHAPSQDACPVA
jgi:hypothetical protein